MAKDDRRMHEGRSRSLDGRPHHGHESHEERQRDGSFGTVPRMGAEDAEDVPSTTDRDQDSALGGHVGTRSGE